MGMTDEEKQRDSDRDSVKEATTDDHKRAGELSIDPVCGKNVDQLSTTFSVEHGGKTYRVCSLACRSKFEADPDAFLLRQ